MALKILLVQASTRTSERFVYLEGQSKGQRWPLPAESERTTKAGATVPWFQTQVGAAPPTRTRSHLVSARSPDRSQCVCQAISDSGTTPSTRTWTLSKTQTQYYRAPQLHAGITVEYSRYSRILTAHRHRAQLRCTAITAVTRILFGVLLSPRNS